MWVYYHFLKENISGITFGLLLTFSSSFGQTFFISLFVPDLLKAFDLTNSSFGLIYMFCTILASIMLLATGHTIDHMPVRKVTYITIFGLAASCLALGFAWQLLVLIIAITGLRFTGQGLLSHISITVMSRYYTENRGKALSLSSIGYSVGEALFPLLVTLFLLIFDWRITWTVSAVLIIVVLFPVLKRYNLETFDEQTIDNRKSTSKQLVRDYIEMIKAKFFWRIAPTVFSLSFVVTGIFFYQFVIAEKEGWPIQWYAVGFTGYAITRFLFSLIGGTWIDKFGANKLFQYILLPMCAGLILLILIPGITGAFLFLFLTGITVGISGSVKAAIIAEEYGTEKIGTIRSLFTMVMVISTAVGPLFLGFLLDSTMSMNNIFMIMLMLLFVSAFFSYWLK